MDKVKDNVLQRYLYDQLDRVAWFFWTHRISGEL